MSKPESTSINNNISTTSKPNEVPAATTKTTTSSPTKLFVGNLHPRITPTHLEKLLQPHATILGPIRRVQTFAFVKVATPEEAQRACAVLHGRSLLQRKLVVELASGEKPKQPTVDRQIQALRRKLQK